MTRDDLLTALRALPTCMDNGDAEAAHHDDAHLADSLMEAEAEVVEVLGCDPSGSGFESRRSPLIAPDESDP